MMPQTNLMPQKVTLRFKVDEYYKLIDLGMLHDYEKAEIVEGELIRKMPIGDKHAMCVDFLATAFTRKLDETILVKGQNPVRFNDYSELMPDITLADLTKFNGRRHPKPNEVLLIVEVSDSTIKYDRDFKIPLYAEAEIPEVWLVNLQKDIFEVHTNPNEGLYQIVKIYKKGEVVKSETIPHLEIEVDKILGE